MGLEELQTVGGSHLGRNYAGQILFDRNDIDGMELSFACDDVQGATEHLVLALLPMELLADGNTFEGEWFSVGPIFIHLLHLGTIGTIVHHVLHTIFAHVMHGMNTFVGRETQLLAFGHTHVEHRFDLVALVQHVAQDFGRKLDKILFTTKRYQSTILQACRTANNLIGVGVGQEILGGAMRLAVDDQPVGYTTFGPCNDVLVVGFIDMRHVLSNAQLGTNVLAPVDQRHATFGHRLEMHVVGRTGSRACTIEEDEIIGEKVGEERHIPHPTLEILTHMFLADDREVMINDRKRIDGHQVLVMHG